jgi:hypothetical protein
MPAPVRSSIGFPIRIFIDIPSMDVLEAVNALVNDVNMYLAPFASGGPPNTPNVTTVGGLPASASEGTIWFATDGRKIGEGPGAGTGVLVYRSAMAWRVTSTDAPVTS